MKSSHWQSGLLAALLITLLSCWPQLDLWWVRGSEYQGAYASIHFDECMYAAYLNGLVVGRPRRSDPLIERQNGQSPPESLFSIQFWQPLLLATVARVTGLSTRMVYILLTPLLAFLSTLALFYLLLFFSSDKRLAFCGSLFILCLGTVAGRDGLLVHLLSLKTEYSGLPFLRRYQPGLSFPLFFVFVLLTWLAVSRRDRRGWQASVAAGLVFALLVFSYFYMWTAAAAWFCVFVALWLFAHRSEWRDMLGRLSPVFITGAITLLGYALLLAQIARTSASTLALEFTHAPDWGRGPEVISAVVLALLFLAVRKRLAQWLDPLPLLILSFVLTLFLLFNQQVLTGRSLQPFHYEIFIGNYVALLALVLTFVLFRRGSGAKQSLLSQRAFFWLCVGAFFWGETEMRLNNLKYRDHNLASDAFMPIARRLNELAVAGGKDINDREILFSPDTYIVADNTAGYAPQALLWATTAFVMPTLDERHRQERFFQHLYYSGVSPEELKERLSKGQFGEVSALFGSERHLPVMITHFNPLSATEIQEKVDRYADFVATFDHHRASRPTLNWVVVPDYSDMNFSRLDRWYARETEERIGAFRLFRVRLREPAVKQEVSRIGMVRGLETFGR